MAFEKTNTSGNETTPHLSPYDCEPSGGMSLQEAFDRYVDPGKLRALELAQNASNRDGNAGAREMRNRVLQALADANADFRARFMSGNLIAWGAEGSPTAIRKPIPALAWQYLRPRLVSDVLIDPNKLKIFSIRIYETSTIDGPDKNNDSTRSTGGHWGKAKLRTALRVWLEKITREHLTKYRKDQYLQMAREKFGPDVTKNLFNEVWRNGDLPPEVKAPGARGKSVL
jgi:hypothetical protein